MASGYDDPGFAPIAVAALVFLLIMYISNMRESASDDFTERNLTGGY